MRATIIACIFASGLYAQKQPFDVTAMLKISRISEPRLSPDGKVVAFTVQTVNVDQNTKPKQIWVVPAAGGAAQQLTHDGSMNERPRWSPDSKRIAFISNRGGSSQIWIMSADGGQPKQITTLSTEAGGVLFSRDGKKLVFTSSVFPSCGADDDCNRKRLDAVKNSKVKARSYTTLLYRHWTEWQTEQRSHVMVVDANGGPVKDLTPGNRDVPPFSLGGPDGYDISPDSTEVCYTINNDAVLATSTNSDLYTVPIAGGEPKRITPNPAADEGPLYSHDGKHIAYRSQSRPGYESDKWQLMVYDRKGGISSSLSDGLDRWVESYSWSHDSARLLFTTEDHGRQGIHMIPAGGGATRTLVSDNMTLDDMQLSPDGKVMIYSGQSGSHPTEIYRVTSAGGIPVQLTHLNDELLAGYALPPLEEFAVDSENADKARVSSFMIKPPGFSENRKYPVLFLIHGGPQGAWGESWTYRWNAEVFAAAGYVVVMPNPRGSVGYGQKFTDEINQDWGGRAYDDIMAVVNNVAARPYVDADRMAAAGGSYGGYMVDWMLGHTQRFKALIAHAGVYDLRSESGATEELWFPNWEFHGMPWDDPDLYTKWSPSSYVKDFHTPTLVIHGEQDFRVPYTQGLQLFTALQMQHVPSKLLLFPDEGHWILKPQNTVLWYSSFLTWIDEWLKKPSAPAANQ